MSSLFAVSVGRILSALGSVVAGVVLGALIAFLLIVRLVRIKIRRQGNLDYADKLGDGEALTITRYVENCENATERIFRRRLKEARKSYLRKKWEAHKERIRNATVPIEPPDEEETVRVDFSGEIWYPVYLMAHNIAVLYKGEGALSFLEITEKQVFDIVRKVGHAVQNILDGMGIDVIKKLKCYAIMETLHLVQVIMAPLSKQGVKDAFRYSKQGYTAAMKVKSVLSINPFYYLKRFFNRKITAELVIECVRCAIDVIAVEIVDLYKNA